MAKKQVFWFSIERSWKWPEYETRLQLNYTEEKQCSSTPLSATASLKIILKCLFLVSNLFFHCLRRDRIQKRWLEELFSLRDKTSCRHQGQNTWLLYILFLISLFCLWRRCQNSFIKCQHWQDARQKCFEDILHRRRSSWLTVGSHRVQCNHGLSFSIFFLTTIYS